MRLSGPKALLIFVLAFCLLGGTPFRSASASAQGTATLVVPRDYPTIQAAVDAAHAGDAIRVRRGTFTEQISIGKDLTIIGAGAGSTVIRAPHELVTGVLGETSIVEIHHGASVNLSRLTVTGPGSGTCDDGALWAGIYASDGAHLDARSIRVTHIRDAQLANCFRSGNAVVIGSFSSSGTADISHSLVSDYQAVGIIALGPASHATVTHNVVTGPGRTPATATGGIEFIAANGTIEHNIVSGNACGSPDLGCGPDFFNEYQLAGITAGAPGTFIRNNVLFANQVGIYVGESAELSDNLSLANDYFGLALQDGTFTVRDDRIVGGAGGVAVIAAFADTTARLDNVHMVGVSKPNVQIFECCGFSATVTATP